MGFTARRDFSLGWCPDCDALNAPPNALLRADNLVLDERGVQSLRRGTAKINSVALADLQVHSLYTTVVNGTRYRMTGAGDSVYANGTSIVSGMTGTGDIPFSFQLGQILFARGTTKKKYDGTTVRNWGIAMTGPAPTTTPVPPDGKTFATGKSSESPAFTVIEDSGAGLSYGLNHYAASDPLFDAAGALKLYPNATSGRATYRKVFTVPQDFTTYDAGETGGDDDVISFYLRVIDPTAFTNFVVQFDVNGGDFVTDWYASPDLDPRLPPSDTVGSQGFADPIPTPPPDGARTRPPGAPVEGTAVPRVTPAVGSTGASGGWMKISYRRGDFHRVGTTSGKDWRTVKAVQVVAQGKVTLPGPLDFLGSIDTIRIDGGGNRPLFGSAQWWYCYVRNDGKYLAKSAPSPASAVQVFSPSAADVTVPADGSRDPQVNEIWIFRQDQTMERPFRSVVKTGVSGTGPFVIQDTTSRNDMLEIDIPIEFDALIPPDNIIGLAGPYYDRTLALTSDGLLWVSRRLDPDAFAAGQAIKVGGADDTPYWIFRALNDVLIGTSRDIYRLEGTGAELPDGSIDYTLRGLSMDHRPLNAGLAHEGNQLAFFSDDGWRATDGTGSTLLTGLTSLLYRGRVRHGVGPVDLRGRIRGALHKGQLVAITPEGTPDTPANSSCVLYRYVFRDQHWYRHTYGSANWVSLHREPDGTLIAGDDAGFVWVIDTGTLDDGHLIPVTCWTRADDLDNPYQRKVLGDLMWRAESGGATQTVAVHVNGSSTPSTFLTIAQTNPTVTPFDLGNITSPHKVPAARQLQLRLTGNFSLFHIYDFGVQFREHPVPLIGRVVDTQGGTPGVKILSGFTVKACTLGQRRILTAFLDGLPDDETFSIQTSAEEFETITLRFSGHGRRATDLGFAVDGEIELDNWSPIVTQRQPVGVLVWDSGPLDIGDGELTWLRGLELKVRAGAELFATPYFDGVEFPTVTLPIDTPDVDTIIRVQVGRAYKGRQPRLVLKSCQPFYPYWIRPIYRSTGHATQKRIATIPVTLQTGGA